MKIVNNSLKESTEDRPITFKITKRRTPWINEV